MKFFIKIMEIFDKKFYTLFLISLSLLFVTGDSNGQQIPSASEAKIFGSQTEIPDAVTIAPVLNKSINLLGYDPLWDGLPHSRFRLSQFHDIKAVGFTAVRINLRAFRYMDANNRLNAAWVERVNEVANAALSEGLAVILDEHDHVDCRAKSDSCAEKLAAFWAQFAPRFANAPSNVLFEIMNEPGGPWTPEMWNGYYARALRIIRGSNPRRVVVLGPACSDGMNCLDKLVLPEDDKQIIVTFHYYLPLAFTHQGTDWNPDYVNKLGVSWGTPEELRALEADFTAVQAWGKVHHRPIFLGEFGAYEKAPQDKRVQYIGAVAQAAERHGFGWAFWQFEQNFALYDMKSNAWNKDMLKALFPERKSSATQR